ncbi:MAG: hypothetical protein M3O22_02555 [Pseudomonadota bacterium]|nr:hypothetical protein [Pseudomonadota bacterium]
MTKIFGNDAFGSLSGFMKRGVLQVEFFGSMVETLGSLRSLGDVVSKIGLAGGLGAVMAPAAAIGFNEAGGVMAVVCGAWILAKAAVGLLGGKRDEVPVAQVHRHHPRPGM